MTTLIFLFPNSNKTLAFITKKTYVKITFFHFLFLQQSLTDCRLIWENPINQKISLSPLWTKKKVY
jgi:hypothetical protein